MIRRPLSSTLFPYTTLFRSQKRNESIAGTNGWTTLISRYWLSEGRTFAGADPTNQLVLPQGRDRKSTRLNSSHVEISYAVFCLKKKKKNISNSTSTSNRTRQ